MPGYWRTFAKIDLATLVSQAHCKTYKGDGKALETKKESTSLTLYSEMYGKAPPVKSFFFGLEVENRVRFHERKYTNG